MIVFQLNNSYVLVQNLIFRPLEFLSRCRDLPRPTTSGERKLLLQLYEYYRNKSIVTMAQHWTNIGSICGARTAFDIAEQCRWRWQGLRNQHLQSDHFLTYKCWKHMAYFLKVRSNAALNFENKYCFFSWIFLHPSLHHKTLHNVF